MSSSNPIHQVLQNLTNELQAMNTNCLHFNVEINALIQERTHVENNKLLRRFCRCLRCVDALKPETSMFYKDRSSEILGMLRHLNIHYDDLKRRYFWALDRLAEMSMKLNSLLEDQKKAEAKNKSLGSSWNEFSKYNDQDDEDTSSSVRSKRMRDIDRLLGMMFIGNESGSSCKSEVTHKKSDRMYAKFVRSSTLEKLKNSSSDKEESIDRAKSRLAGFQKSLQKLGKPKKKASSITKEKLREIASAAEIKMEVYGLMAEVSERDELIGTLVAQMKVKDAQISQLLEVIERERLGL